MSITQLRMIDLIDEFAQLKTQYNALRAAVQAGQDPQTILLRYPAFQSETLAREQEHFKIWARRNQKTADKARRRRLTQGMKPRQEFTTVKEKLDQTNLQPQNTVQALQNIQPLTYLEALAQDYSPWDLKAMFPDEAPEPPSTDIPEDMYRV